MKPSNCLMEEDPIWVAAGIELSSSSMAWETRSSLSPSIGAPDPSVINKGLGNEEHVFLFFWISSEVKKKSIPTGWDRISSSVVSQQTRYLCGGYCTYSCCSLAFWQWKYYLFLILRSNLGSWVLCGCWMLYLRQCGLSCNSGISISSSSSGRHHSNP